MEPNQINEVVEKLSEKIGIAVEALQPIAETLLQELQSKLEVSIWGNSIALVITSIILIQCYRITMRFSKLDNPTSLQETYMLVTCFVIFGGSITFILTTDALVNNIGKYLSPTLTLLQSL